MSEKEEQGNSNSSGKNIMKGQTCMKKNKNLTALPEYDVIVLIKFSYEFVKI